MSKQQTLYLHTGSNQGDRISILRKANEFVGAEIGPIILASSFYETAPWGNEDQANFINQALKVTTLLSPSEVLSIIHNIEKKLGRLREVKWAPRAVDIDILFYHNQIIRTDQLIVPHPHLQNRNFVLFPMLEIAPKFIHPKLGLSIETLFLQSKDKLEVYLANPSE